MFDASVDFNYAGLIGAYSYIKYGATVSKNIHEFEPFVHYYLYHSVGKMVGSGSDSFDGFISNLTTEFINNSRTVGFGIGIPISKIKLFPEADYQYFNNSIANGLWHFGIGMRIYTN